MVLTELAGLFARFQFPINFYDTYFDDPLTHMYGEEIKGEWKEVRNDGNVPAPFKVIFHANTELSKPMITLVEHPVSTKFIVVEKDMVAGETITVDMTGETITAISKIGSEETDVFAYLGLDSTFFSLAVGSNIIRYDAEINRDSLDVSILRDTAYAGAFGDDKTYE